MRRFFASLVTIAWGLWFGGVITLFLAVQSLFAAFADRRELAGTGASAIFQRFNVYQLLMALLAITGSLAVQAGGAGRRNATLLGLLGLAAGAALVVAAIITPRIETLRLAGDVHSEQFRQLHGLSMIVYCAEVILLLLAGLLLPATSKGGHRR